MKDYHHLYIFGAATQRWFCFDLPYPIYVVLLSHLLSQLLGRLQTKHVVLGRDKEVKTKQLIGQRLVNLSAKHAGVDPKGREGRGGGRGGEVGGGSRWEGRTGGEVGWGEMWYAARQVNRNVTKECIPSLNKADMCLPPPASGKLCLMLTIPPPPSHLASQSLSKPILREHLET